MFKIPATKATDPESRFEFEFDGKPRSAPLMEFVDTDTEALFTSAITGTDEKLAYCRALADSDAEVEAGLRRAYVRLQVAGAA
jgi:hypothetical protein